jgi:hypothetical protein
MNKKETKPTKKTKTIFTKDKGIVVIMVPAEESKRPFTLGDLLFTVAVVLAGILGGLVLGSYLIN